MIPATPAPAHRPLDLGLAPDAEEFRAEVCAWLTRAMALGRIAAHRDPADRTGLTEEFERALLAEAGGRGWLGISLPSGAGGGGRPASWAAAFAYEAAWHHAPLVDTGVVLASAPVAAYGSAGQRGRLLPAMLDGRETWCCAYTEHASGNDLFAGLRTRARQDGDGTWRITGTKALVTGAAKADRCLTVAQTPGGTAMFVVALRRAVAESAAVVGGGAAGGGVVAAEGVEIRRIPTIAGYTLDEIVFDGAEAELLGEVGAGRRQVARAVRAEHGGLFQLGWAHRLVSDLTACLAGCGGGEFGASGAGAGADRVDGIEDGVCGWGAAERTGALAAGAVDPGLGERLGGIWVRLLAGRGTALAPVVAIESGRPDPVAAMLAKIRLTELVRDTAREAASAVRYAASGSLSRARGERGAWEGRFAAEAVMRLDGPISVGANDLHREAVASFVLGERLFAGGPALDAEEVAGPLSAARRALETAVERVNSRTAYGTTVSRLPVVRRRLADMYGELDAARRLAEQAEAPGAAEEVVLAAADYVGRTCRGVVEEAVELYGGHGYLAETGLGGLLSAAYEAERWAEAGPSPRVRIAVRVLAAASDAECAVGAGVPVGEGSGR